MRSNASIAGHPLHPIIVAVPIGLWSFALVADLLALLVHDPHPWKLVAFFCIGGGLVGAVLAGLSGLIDYARIPSPKVKAVATVHLCVNLAASALYALSFGLRWRAWPATDGLAPVVLAAAGFVLVGLGGWLGGELVYRYGVAVDEVKEGEPEERKRQG